MLAPKPPPERLELILRTTKDYREGIPPQTRSLGSAMHAKIYRYGQEPYFQESCRDFISVFGNQFSLCGKLTYVLFKPDAFVTRSVARALDVLHALDFHAVAAAEVTFERFRVRELWRYEFNIARVERYQLIDDLLCSGPSLLVALEDCSATLNDASARLSMQKGNSNLSQRAANSIRTKIGARANTLNFIHTPDELLDMVREFGVLFDGTARRELLKAIVAKDDSHISAKIQKIYDGYPEHSLSVQDVYRHFGEGLKEDVAKFAEILAERPYSIYEQLAAKQGLGLWDWITLVNSHLRFSHEGVQPVFSFEGVE